MTFEGKIGFGGKVSGEAVVLPLGLGGGKGRPEPDLDTHHLRMDLAGKILIVLTNVGREFLEKAAFIGVAGVVLPSMHFRDFEYFSKNADFSLLVLTKFGRVELPTETAVALSRAFGKAATLDGAKMILEV